MLLVTATILFIQYVHVTLLHNQQLLKSHLRHIGKDKQKRQ